MSSSTVRSVESAKSAITSARGIGESLIGAAQRWNDPRAKQLRRIKRARRRGVAFGGLSGASAAGTAGLALVSAPDAALLATGGTAVFLALPATFALTRYRRLRAAPLPVSAPTKRTLPPRSSAAYDPMARLAGAERSLYELLGVLTRSEFVGADDIEETAQAARAAADALGAVTVDVLAMERAAQSTTSTRRHLEPSIASAVAELSTGVDQYEDLVAAAAKMTSPVGSGAGAAAEKQRGELLSATDRLYGWAAALEELAEIRARHH